MVQCVECGAYGTVDDPTKEEWSEAYHAPSRPYRWEDFTRITPKGWVPTHVIRTTGGPKCECYARLGRLRPGDFERFPAEIMAPTSCLDEGSRGELNELADLVGTSDLCSLLFPHFVRGVQEYYGFRHCETVNEVAERIGQIASKGLHFSPGVVAKVLRDFAMGAR
jgi:hypothetical protein